MKTSGLPTQSWSGAAARMCNAQYEHSMRGVDSCDGVNMPMESVKMGTGGSAHVALLQQLNLIVPTATSQADASKDHRRHYFLSLGV